jgi:lysophospholipase L1-like esterase
MREEAFHPREIMTSQSQSRAGNSAVIPTPKLEEDFYDWYERHDAKCRETAGRNHDLIFIGDSITHLFEGDPNVPNRGERVWKEYYGTRQAMNLGFGWDRTQNVLWRLAHGEFTGQIPRLIVLLIGSNNLTGTEHAPTNTPAEIAEGIRAVCEQLLAASPKSRILLMGIFPRGAANDPLRTSVRELNDRLKPYASRHSSICFADIGQSFLSADGSIPLDIMNDGLHLTEKGYRIWAEAIEPTILRWVGPR